MTLNAKRVYKVYSGTGKVDQSLYMTQYREKRSKT